MEPPENNIPQPPPHLAVEAGSVMPLSDFTRDLKIKEFFMEQFDLKAKQLGYWQPNQATRNEIDSKLHFIEFDLTTQDLHTAFFFDKQHKVYFPNEPFLDCMEYDNKFEYYTHPIPGNYNELIDGFEDVLLLKIPESSDDPIYAKYPWLKQVNENLGALPMLGFLRAVDITPHGIVNNTNVFGEDASAYFHIGFVQSGPDEMKLYIAWREYIEGVRSEYQGFNDEIIEEEFDRMMSDLRFCLHPTLNNASKQKIRKLAEKRAQFTASKSLTGTKTNIGKNIPYNLARKISSYVPLERKRSARKTRKARRSARKSRRNNRR